MKYYAVRKGYNPGIYTTWKECLGQVTGFKGAIFKSFTSEADAKSFMEGNDPTLDPDSSVYVAKWYGVRSGKCPGVYSTWKAAQEQVVGVQKPKVKAFATREEAEAFVASGPGVPSSPLPDDRKTRASKDMNAARRDTVVSTATTTPRKRKSTFNESVADAESISGETVSDEMLEDEYNAVDPAARQLEEEHAADEGTDGHRAKRHKSSKPAVPRKTTVLKIYTDGSTMGNGREEAIGGVGVWFGSNDVRNISEPLTGTRQTNQRAELSAIKRALEIAPRHREVLIFSDSQYAINCVTLWHHNWSRNNWLTTLGKKVENQDLIEEILEKMQEREDIGAKTGFEWVKGHSGGTDGNSQADRLAVEGARKAKAMNGGPVLRR